MYGVDLQRLRRLRKARGLTQLDVALALGYKSDVGYHYLETGKCVITADHLARLAELLEVRIEDLFEKSLDPTGTEGGQP